MAKNSPAFSPNDRIDHSVYGTGTILEVTARLTTIRFDGAGTKRFMTNIVQLAPSDSPAPPRPVRRRKPVARPA